MSTDFATWARQIGQLHAALEALSADSTRLGVADPSGAEWFELLRWKLVPQVERDPHLVVGIVGGTNIGKSVVFNHLAGEIASGVSPLAAGTKHPVCLIPNGMLDPSTLATLFDGFELAAWQSAHDPLGDCPEDMLFWRVGANVPPRLLVLDAPDVDSDVPVNWARARAIRQAADVLVAVLTQQKYNDAAVKQFFREAVRADKPIVVVFNQCDPVRDREYWPQWLATFCTETGARPELVYVVPHDRDAVAELRLPFYNVGPDGRDSATSPSSLREDLASLHFDAIKIRTLRGALARVVDPEHGAPAYLETVRAAAGEFSAASGVLSAAEMARVAWPTLPPSVLVEEIRQWWDQGRSPWSQNIHGFYRTVGRGVTWPVRTAWNLTREEGEPLEPFHRRESEAIVAAVGKMLDELERLTQVGNETLRPRLLELLGGKQRETLLGRVRETHASMPAVDDAYRCFLRGELDAWKQANPRAVRFLRSLDHVAALARPAITISLAVSGFVVAGDLVGQAAGQAAVQAAGHTAGELATEAAIAGGIAGGGEAVVGTASEGVRQAAGRLFGRLQSRYAQQRADWLAHWLEQELLGSLLGDLRQGADVPQGDAFQTAAAVLASLDLLKPSGD